MNIIAVALALVALAIFVATHLAVARKWASQPLGLAFLTAAIIVQAAWATTHRVLIGGG